MASCGVLLGVVAGILHPLATSAAGGLIAGGLVIVWYRLGRISLMGFVALGLGAGALASAAATRPAAVAWLAPSWCRLDGHVLERAGGLGTLVAVESAECGDQIVRNAGVVVLDGNVGEMGSSIRAEGYLSALAERDFDQARRRAGAQAGFESDGFRLEPPDSWSHKVAWHFRRALRGALRGLNGERGALLAGLTIGETDGLSEDTETRVRRAGLSHLVAVSGSNVALVLGSVLWATSRAPRLIRQLVAGIALFLFVFVVGPDPSVLRAASMGVVTLIALSTNVRADPLSALVVSLVVLLVIRPGILFSVGLHLSVAATLGIVLFAQPLLASLHALPRPVALVIAATLAAQIAVAPILILVFGEVSVIAPLANLLALGAVPFATAAAAAAGMAQLLVPALGPALASIAEPCAWWILEVARLGDLPWASVEVAPVWGSASGAVVVIAMVIAIRGRGVAPLGSTHGRDMLGPDRSVGR